MSELFNQTIVVVDGLDECGDRTDDVVEILEQLATNHESLSMALFSRDHQNIRDILELDFKHIPIKAHTEDIRIHVGAELAHRIQTRRLQLTSATMRDEIAAKLVERADGMYVLKSHIISPATSIKTNCLAGSDGSCVRLTTSANVLMTESDARLIFMK